MNELFWIVAFTTVCVALGLFEATWRLAYYLRWKFNIFVGMLPWAALRASVFTLILAFQSDASSPLRH